MKKFTVPIRGMHCRSCEILIERNLKNIKGVASVDVSHRTGVAKVEFQGSQPSKEEIQKAVQAAGYTVGQKEKLPWVSNNPEDYFFLLLSASVLFALYLFASMTGLFNLNINTNEASLGVVVLVGLVAGFSSCMALIGGLVLALAARHAELHPEATAVQKFRPHLFFNAGRIGGYALLGGVIGLLGSALQPSASTMGLLTIAVGGVMIFLGLKLVEIFPALKDTTFALPKSVSRAFGIRGDAKEYSHRGAMFAGALTFFLPCGFTQAMQLYAVSTGSFTQGALIMGFFAVGTAPGLLGVGGLSSIFKGMIARIFFVTAGLAVIVLGVYNITNASRVVFAPRAGVMPPSGVVTGSVQEVRMTQSERGYSPSQFTVKKGMPVRWIINSTNQFTCAAYISMPAYGINQPLKAGENVIEFTPTKTGEIPFTCSMGMYRGKFIVVDGDANTEPVPSAPSNQGVLAPTPFVALANAGGGACGGGRGGCAMPAGRQGCGGAKNAFQPQAGTVENQQAGNAVAASVQVVKTVYTYDQDINPNSFAVKAGTPVRVEVEAKDNGSGCMSSIMIPGLYDQPQYLQKGKLITMEFTPRVPGEYPITCAMGVKRGSITVQ